jgi:hypothetical protein
VFHKDDCDERPIRSQEEPTQTPCAAKGEILRTARQSGSARDPEPGRGRSEATGIATAIYDHHHSAAYSEWSTSTPACREESVKCASCGQDLDVEVCGHVAHDPKLDATAKISLLRQSLYGIRSNHNRQLINKNEDRAETSSTRLQTHP